MQHPKKQTPSKGTNSRTFIRSTITTRLRARLGHWDVDTHHSTEATTENPIKLPSTVTIRKVQEPTSTTTTKPDEPSPTTTRRPKKTDHQIYIDLVTQAISTSPVKKLSLDEISNWLIENENIPQCTEQNFSKWKHDVIRVLTTQNNFIKVKNREPPGYEWMLRPISKNKRPNANNNKENNLNNCNTASTVEINNSQKCTLTSEANAICNLESNVGEQCNNTKLPLTQSPQHDSFSNSSKLTSSSLISNECNKSKFPDYYGIDPYRSRTYSDSSSCSDTSASDNSLNYSTPKSDSRHISQAAKINSTEKANQSKNYKGLAQNFQQELNITHQSETDSANRRYSVDDIQLHEDALINPFECDVPSLIKLELEIDGRLDFE